MKLTAEDVAKATKLSLATVRAYARQRKIGTKVGSKRLFTMADLKKFTTTKGSSKAPARAKAATPKVSRKAIAKVRPVVKHAATAKEEPKEPARRSFWDLLMNRKSKQKVRLMDVQKK